MPSLSQHWNGVYEADPSMKKWHQDSPTVSLTMISMAGIQKDDAIVDVGGGASRLAQHLVELGYRDVTVLDVSERGMAHAQHGLGEAVANVTWVVGDVTQHHFERAFDVWHDRAVFHFLSDEAEIKRYQQRLSESVALGGHAVIATFAPDAPEYCSGLPVVRYDVEGLAAAVGKNFEMIESAQELHRTPGGELQPFTWVLLQRV